MAGLACSEERPAGPPHSWPSSLPACVLDIGASMMSSRLTGTRAADLIGMGSGLPLSRLADRSCTRTRFARFRILIHTGHPGPCYDLYVGRSYARALWGWIGDAG